LAQGNDSYYLDSNTTSNETTDSNRIASFDYIPFGFTNDSTYLRDEELLVHTFSSGNEFLEIRQSRIPHTWLGADEPLVFHESGYKITRTRNHSNIDIWIVEVPYQNETVYIISTLPLNEVKRIAKSIKIPKS
jgi:hypothetical protein